MNMPNFGYFTSGGKYMKKLAKIFSAALALTLVLVLLPCFGMTAYAAPKEITQNTPVGTDVNVGDYIVHDTSVSDYRVIHLYYYGDYDDTDRSHYYDRITITNGGWTTRWEADRQYVLKDVYIMSPSRNILFFLEEPLVPVTSVTLTPNPPPSIAVGGTQALTATVVPDNATDKTVTWSSSNTAVATVSDDGVVTAVGAGEAIITATATNGTTDTGDDQTATCTVTVYVPHTHNWSYSASGDTITANCSTSGCPVGSQTVNLALNKTRFTYGEAVTPTVTVSDGWTTANGLVAPPTTTDVVYVNQSGTANYNSSTAPTNAGSYTAQLTVRGATATKNFTIAKANPTANPPSLNATYGQTLADLTLSNPSGNTPGTWTWADNTSTSVGNAGTKNFKANFTPTDTTNYNSISNVDVPVTVGKAANPATVTGSASVTKGGNTVDLSQFVSPNGATGAVTYAIPGDNKGCTLSGSVLTSGANTGDVTVNVTIAADSNYNALPATPITVTVTDKQTQEITVPDNITVTYGDTGKSIGASLTKGDGTLSYAVKKGDAVTVNGTTGELTIAKAGTAVVTVTASETNGFAKAEKDVTVTVGRKELTIKAKDQSISVGDAVPSLASPAADTHYTVTGLVGSDTLTTPPTLTYQKDGSSANPDNTKAGSYDIVPSGAEAGDNYTISYQNGTLTVSDMKFYCSDGDEQQYKQSDMTFTFKMKGDDADTFEYVKNFKKATIKGPDIDRALNSDEYTISEGSLKLKLNNSFLKTLKAGTYTLTVYFLDESAAHSASATFTISKRSAGGGVKTGDKIMALVVSVALFLLSLTVVAYILHKKHVLEKFVPALYSATGGLHSEKDDRQDEQDNRLLELLYPDRYQRRPERNYRRYEGDDRRYERRYPDSSVRRAARYERRPSERYGRQYGRDERRYGGYDNRFDGRDDRRRSGRDDRRKY